MINVKGSTYTLSMTVAEKNNGMVDFKLTYQSEDKPSELVIEKVSNVSSIKQLMDGIFKELYLATETKKS